jgi:hypothetical protein
MEYKSRKSPFYNIFKKSNAGLFFTGWGSSPVLTVGEKLHGIFAKGEEKTWMLIQFLGKTV